MQKHDVDHLSDMSDNNHFDKYDLKEMDTQIAKILIETKDADNSVGMSSNVDTDKDSNKNKDKVIQLESYCR